MKIKIKRLHSPDIQDLQQFSPLEKDNFGFLLQVMIGEKGQEGEESFDIMVLTPKWLTENYNNNDIVFGFHHIIMFDYNYQLLLNKLINYIENINADNWDEFGNKINLIGKWEFSNYSY